MPKNGRGLQPSGYIPQLRRTHGEPEVRLASHLCTLYNSFETLFLLLTAVGNIFYVVT